MEKEIIIKQDEFQKEAFPAMDSLFNSALKLTYNEEDARDLVQDTYFKAFKFFDKYERGTSIKAWMFRIMKNTFINNYRKKVKQPVIVDFDDVEPFIDRIILDKDTVTGEDIDHILNNTLSDDVSQALYELSDDFRIVLVLSDIEDFSYKEIANIMNIPIGTVRSRLFRARKALFEKLQKNAKKEGYLSGRKFGKQENHHEENNT